jgi:hypothetical protein
MKYFLLPNAINFVAIKTGMNLIADIFGMKKVEREMFVERDKEITIANNYLKKQYRRLERYRKDGKTNEYESLSKTLIQKSIIYRLALFNHKNSGWYYTGKAQQQKRLFERVSLLASKLSTAIEIQRVYISKKPNSPDKYGRPLGSNNRVENSTSNDIKLHARVVLTS